MLYEPPKTKQYIIIGVAALVILALVFWGAWKMKTKPVDAPPASVQKTNEEKQKDMSDAINKANESSAQKPLPPEEQTKKQQDMTDTINEANIAVPQISAEETQKRQQDMLNAINEANQK